MIYKKIIIIISSLAILTAFPLFAEKTLSVDKSLTSKNISKYLIFIEDSEEKLTINDVAGKKLQWTHNNKSSVNFGYSNKPYWFRFTADNSADVTRELYLELDYPLLDYIELYQKNKDGTFIKKKTGDRRSFNTRDIFDRKFIFKISLSPGENTYYVRIKTESSFRFRAFIMTHEAYTEKTNTQNAALWLFFGMLLIIAVYHIFYIIAERDLASVSMLVFVVGIFFHQFALRGLAYQFLWTDAFWFQKNCMVFFMSVSSLGGGLFLITSINARINFKIYYWLMIVLVVIPGSLIMILSLIIDHRYLIKPAIAVLGVIPVLGSVMIIRALVKKNRYALFLMVGLLVPMVILPVNIFTTLGYLSVTSFTVWNFDYALLWFVILSSLGLSDRINLVRRELVINEERLSLALEGTTDGLWDYSPTSGNIYYSPRWFTMLGYRPDELPHTFETWTGLLHPDDRDRVMAAVREYLESKNEYYNSEFRMRNKDGSWQWINARGKAVEWDRDRNIARVVGTNTDITEQKEYQCEIIREKELNENIINSMPGVFYLYDKDVRLLRCNRNFESVTGYSGDELKNKIGMDFVADEDREKVAAAIGTVLSEGHASVEAGIKTRDGKRVTYYLEGVSFFEEENEYFLGFGIDISGMKRMENDLRTSLNEKELLLRELYHRTKNNMQVICSMLSLVALQKDDEILNRIFGEVEMKIQAMALVHQKLYESQDLSSIDVRDYITGVVFLILQHYNADPDKIKVDQKIEDLTLSVDSAVPFGLVINELLTNSMKHAFPGDGSGLIEIEACREGEAITLLYRDNGVGLPSSYDPDNTDSLGMTILREIVRNQLRGEIKYISHNGFSCEITIKTELYKKRM